MVGVTTGTAVSGQKLFREKVNNSCKELGIGNNNNQHNPVRVSNLNKVFVTKVKYQLFRSVRIGNN